MKSILIGALLAVAVPAAASAQKLEAGKWQASATTPSGETVALDFVVTTTADVSKARMSGVALPEEVDVVDLKLDGIKLTFAFHAGDDLIRCTLDRTEAGDFAGPCADANGAAGRLVLKRPAADAAGSATAGAAGGRPQAGKWEGLVNHPSMGDIPVVLEVVAEPARTMLVLAGGEMSFPIDKLALAGPKLSFAFVVEGQGDVRCELTQKEDKSYAGSCVESGGETSQVTLRAPVSK